jgi:PEP-CTERM motif
MARLFFLAFVVASLCNSSQAGVLTNGSLTVGLRSNGAIDFVEFGGINFFKPGFGTDVSDFGLQRGSDVSSFRLNNTSGAAGLALTESGFSYTGTHDWGSDRVNYLRSYSLVAGRNALRVTSTVTNLGLAGLEISQFETFDPDQAYSFLAPLLPPGVLSPLPFQTFNDVLTVAGVQVGQASINARGHELTMLIGSYDSRAVVASGDPLQIVSGDDLNEFFRAPQDAEGLLADQGTHIGFRQFLNPNQSTTFTYILAFGETPTQAQQAFTLTSVPEPGSIVAFGALGLCGLFFCRRRTKL